MRPQTSACGGCGSDHPLFGQLPDVLLRHPQQLAVHVVVVLAVAGPTTSHRLFFPTSYSLCPLLSFYLCKNAFEHLSPSDSWMPHHVVFRSVMQVMGKRIDTRVMWSVVPPLDQETLAILPVVTISGDLKSALSLQDALGHLDKPALAKPLLRCFQRCLSHEYCAIGRTEQLLMRHSR